MTSYCADDELHNVNISENAKTKHALDLKKKGRQAGQYTGLDDDEFEGGPGTARGVLSKYDEDFDSIKVDGFRLGSVSTADKGKGRATDDRSTVEGGEREKVKLSMDYTSKQRETSPLLSPARGIPRAHFRDLRAESFNTDYLQEGEAGFKKPKVWPLTPLRPDLQKH